MLWLHLKFQIARLEALVGVFHQLLNCPVIDPNLRSDHGIWAHGLVVDREAFDEEEVLFQSLSQIDLEAWCRIFEAFFLRTSLDILIIFKNVNFLVRLEGFRLLI